MRHYQHEGINLEGDRDAGSCLIQYFSFIPGKSESVANFLLDLLNPETEFYLSNDHGDGATTFRIVDGSYESMSGGHGRNGNWTQEDKEVMVKKIKMLSQFNIGSHFNHKAGIVQKMQNPKDSFSSER